MKKKQIEEIRNKKKEEIFSEIRKNKEEILKLRLDLKTGKLKNTSQLRTKKDETAVLKTILKEKTLMEVEQK